jgi:hypothetical protein
VDIRSHHCVEGWRIEGRRARCQETLLFNMHGIGEMRTARAYN